MLAQLAPESIVFKITPPLPTINPWDPANLADTKLLVVTGEVILVQVAPLSVVRKMMPPIPVAKRDKCVAEEAKTLTSANVKIVGADCAAQVVQLELGVNCILRKIAPLCPTAHTARVTTDPKITPPVTLLKS